MTAKMPVQRHKCSGVSEWRDDFPAIVPGYDPGDARAAVPPGTPLTWAPPAPGRAGTRDAPARDAPAPPPMFRAPDGGAGHRGTPQRTLRV